MPPTATYQLSELRILRFTLDGGRFGVKLGVGRRENRRYERHVRRINVKFRELGREQWRTAFTTDISVGGMFISSRTIPDSEIVEVEIQISDGEQLSLRGKVVRGTRVANRLQRLQRGGFAIEVEQPAPEGWYNALLAMDRR